MTPEPRRIAIVGTGPSAMYALEELLERRSDVEVDLFERLPTPWGLVRAGVAPDHPEKKLVIDRQFSFFLRNGRARLFGNVEIGNHITVSELAQWYDAVIIATGADGDRRMDIPGEDLAGSWSARQFVACYNGRPDCARLPIDLSCDRAVIVGNGNVALDVARILTAPIRDLEATDIAPPALERLRSSAIKEVYILGRRDHWHGAFSNPELEELEHLDGVEVVVDSPDFPGENLHADWATRRKVATLSGLAARSVPGARKRIVLKFCISPIALLGKERVEGLQVARPSRVAAPHGGAAAQGGDEIISTGLVVRAVGYKGRPFPGLPYDAESGIIPNSRGRVLYDNQALPSIYVTGWAKRGCRGVIGSNKKCARETVEVLLEDLAGRAGDGHADPDDVAARVRQRQPAFVSRAGWLAIDHAERHAGRLQGRPRVKMTDLDAMLKCAADA